MAVWDVMRVGGRNLAHRGGTRELHENAMKAVQDWGRGDRAQPKTQLPLVTAAS